jgi:PBS lyase HEAT-like repeat
LDGLWLEVRASAAEALGEIQDVSTLDAPQQASVLDAGQMVRAAAIDSIARFHIAY